MNLYENLKFIRIYGIFKQINDFRKRKNMNSVGPTSAQGLGFVGWQPAPRGRPKGHGGLA
jgi:hypothetical protein